MTRQIMIAASVIALASLSSEAFAYSNVSPKETPQKVTSDQQSMPSFSAFGRTMPSWTIEPDNYHYHGGPKSSE